MSKLSLVTTKASLRLRMLPLLLEPFSFPARGEGCCSKSTTIGIFPRSDGGVGSASCSPLSTLYRFLCTKMEGSSMAILSPQETKKSCSRVRVGPGLSGITLLSEISIMEVIIPPTSVRKGRSPPPL